MLRCFSRPQGGFWGEDALPRSLAGARLRAIISPPLTGCAHHPIQNLRLFRPLAGRGMIKAAAPQKVAAQSDVPIRRQPHTKQGRMLFIAAEQRVCRQPHTERSGVWGQRHIQPSEFRRNGFINVAPPKLNIYKPSPSPHRAQRSVGFSTKTLLRSTTCQKLCSYVIPSPDCLRLAYYPESAALYLTSPRFGYMFLSIVLCRFLKLFYKFAAQTVLRKPRSGVMRVGCVEHNLRKRLSALILD